MAKNDRLVYEVENAILLFKNFAGAEGLYNAAGRRNFCVMLGDNLAEDLTKNGFNVKYTKPHDEDDEPHPYVKVNVNYDSAYPPQITLHTSHGATLLDASNVNTLDFADITKASVQFTGYHAPKADPGTHTAWLSIMHVEIREDPFSAMYDHGDDVPDSALNTIEFSKVVNPNAVTQAVK